MELRLSSKTLASSFCFFSPLNPCYSTVMLVILVLGSENRVLARLTPPRHTGGRSSCLVSDVSPYCLREEKQSGHLCQEAGWGARYAACFTWCLCVLKNCSHRLLQASVASPSCPSKSSAIPQQSRLHPRDLISGARCGRITLSGWGERGM